MATATAAKKVAPKTGKPRVYLLWGQEELRKREALGSLIDELVPPEDRALDVEYLDATSPGLSGETILHAARDRAMFSERRVVVVQNAGRLRGPRHQRTQEVLASGLASLPDFSTLMLVAEAEDGDERRGKAPFGETLMAALKAAGEVRQFSPLKAEELAELAVREAAEAGKKLPPAAAAALARAVGTDSQRLLQEVRKLSSYVGDRATITVEDVAVMAPPPPEDSIFRLLDAALGGNRAQALELLANVRLSGTEPQQILVMLGRTLRQIAQAKLLAERRVPSTAERDQVPEEVFALLPDDNLYRTTKDWQRKRLWQQAARFSWPALQLALDRLAVTDAGAKGWEYGIADADLGLELYLVALCDALRAAPARSASSGRSGWR